MKATVQLSFKDKETARQYSIGQTFEGTPERIAEINKALKGALQIILEPTPEQLDLEVETETIIKKRRRSKKA
ncbi:hypothetical protein [Flavobacterium sp.]|uniref:hypothetical protein n=1 Tax=Flavobacterium sp. TaxID=239 RepID=UPI0033411A00